MRNAGFQSLLTSIVFALLPIASPPLPAQDTKASVSYVRALSPSSIPAAGTPSIALSNLTVGPQVQGYPCFGGTNGCPNPVFGTIATPDPLFAFPRNSLVTYTFLWQDLNYKGACTAEYTLVREGTTLDSQTFSFPGGCAPSNLYLVGLQGTIPASAGPAVLHGKLTAGAVTSELAANITIE